MALLTPAPAHPDAQRQALYGGALLFAPACAASQTLVDRAWEALERELGAAPRGAHGRLPVAQLLEGTARARASLQTPENAATARALLQTLGHDPAELALDALRLRGVQHDGHLNPRAAPAYAVHRDTWYANPRAQLNLWIPLHPVGPEDSFTLWPERFGRAVPNNSADFDYSRFLARGGFQGRTHAAKVYPSAERPSQPGRSFSLERAQVLLFSAAQLHGTNPNSTGRSRFSLELRVVHRGDHRAGVGAPDPDNESRGSALPDYRW